MPNTGLGLIHIYYGDGKGKTSAALGLAIRSAGNGYKVLINRFLKNSNSCELPILKNIPGITVTGSEKDFGFFFSMSPDAKNEASTYYTNQLKDAFKKAIDEKFNVLILDEINVAVNLGLIDEALLLELIRNKPSNMELIMTGRDPSKAMIELADYVSEIKNIKHPFEKGITSRLGIEE